MNPSESHVSIKRKVLIVDDHPIVRTGLAQLLNIQSDLSVCGEAGDALSALRSMDALKPDMVIVDISLEGKSGLHLIGDLLSRYPELPILVLSIHDELVYAERALRAGAKGYVMKNERPDLIVKAIRQVLKGQVFVSERALPRLLGKMVGTPSQPSASSVDGLSNRELEIFRLIASGFRTKEIAETLNLSKKTIDTYKEHIKEKLNLKSTSQILRYALQWTEGGK
jgi:DNA-binding NarL/FixJ family response regulator